MLVSKTSLDSKHRGGAVGLMYQVKVTGVYSVVCSGINVVFRFDQK